MTPLSYFRRGLALAAFLSASPPPVWADNFGSGPNAFTIDFANVGNPGNGKDLGAGGGSYSSPLGSVPYGYRIGVTEVPLNWLTKAAAGGMADVTTAARSPDHPAGLVEWHEAAAFVNWLNTSTGHHAAYDLGFSDAGWRITIWETEESWNFARGTEPVNRFRHKDAFYFLPSEDEWYKAAYHKNDGATANYWDYPTASNTAPTAVASGTAPDTAVLGALRDGPAPVNETGGLSAYGTRGQGGNVMEWMEGNRTFPEGSRALGGGWWASEEVDLRSSQRGESVTADSHENVGFRVASIPEPGSAALALAGAALLLRRGRR